QDADLLAYYKKLIAIRQRIAPNLRSPRQTLLAAKDSGLYCYSYASEPKIIVLFNLGKQEQKAELDLPGAWLDLFRDNQVVAQERLTVLMPSLSATVLMQSAN